MFRGGKKCLRFSGPNPRCFFVVPWRKTLNLKRKHMSAKIEKNEYMLIFRGTDWYKGLSTEQMQAITSRWMTWFNRLKDQGKALAGNPLENEGRLVVGKEAKVLADGPFAESKEAIGGYFLLRVDSMDAAVEIAKECPGLPYGIKVEVRQVAPECPIETDLRKEELLAHTA